MQPYVESGRRLQAKLQSRGTGAEEQRLMASLRGFKQVINVIGVTAIVLIPLIGGLARSSFVAACVALNFLAVILMLELLERGVKKALYRCRKDSPRVSSDHRGNDTCQSGQCHTI